MNNQNQSPLVPQGSLLEQKNRGRARVKIAVSIVLAVHGVGLLALLLQAGCQKEQPAEQQAPEPAVTNEAPAFEQPTNTPTVDTNTPPPSAPPVVENPPPVAPPATAGEYTVVSGDTLDRIARKNNVTLKALMAANPGVQPTKLQIGQKLQIPAPTAPTIPSAGTTAPDTTGGAQTYKVKSGDSLTSIARRFGVTVKALRAANNLKTDSIRVGQVLKIPVKASAPASAPGTSTEPAVPSPAPAPTTPTPGQ